MIPQVRTVLETAAEELHIPPDDLVVRGLRSFLERQFREVQAEIFRITGHYGVSGVEDMEARYRNGTLRVTAMARLRKHIAGGVCNTWTTWSTNGIVFHDCSRLSHEAGGC